MKDEKPHPLVSLYGDTVNRQFPLIVVIGREPNDPGKEIGHNIGHYCCLTKNDNNCTIHCHETRRRNVPFWNLSYSLFAETVGKTGMELKQSCVRRNSSPIAYTDISPKTTTKDGKRIRCETGEYLNHLKEISLSEIFCRNRVKLVVFSGLKWPAWAKRWYGDAVDAIEKELADVKSVNVPFFVGNNRKSIKGALQTDTELVCSIIKRWDEIEAPHTLLSVG